MTKINWERGRSGGSHIIIPTERTYNNTHTPVVRSYIIDKKHIKTVLKKSKLGTLLIKFKSIANYQRSLNNNYNVFKKQIANSCNICGVNSLEELVLTMAGRDDVIKSINDGISYRNTLLDEIRNINREYKNIKEQVESTLLKLNYQLLYANPKQLYIDNIGDFIRYLMTEESRFKAMQEKYMGKSMYIVNVSSNKIMIGPCDHE